MTPTTQVKLLRDAAGVDSGELGGASRRVDVRVIAATTSTAQAVRDVKLREDLCTG